MNLTNHEYYNPDQWFLNLSGLLGLLTVTFNLIAFIRALKVRKAKLFPQVINWPRKKYFYLRFR